MSSLPQMMVGVRCRAVPQQRDHPLRERRHVRARAMHRADAAVQFQFAGPQVMLDPATLAALNLRRGASATTGVSIGLMTQF
ncbi:hypothetical protein [Burkholderia metallica]|uniref:hypothetical protein n=1 Tax=Burkholderia metallica TaxID=488729 RepID=UPI001581FC8C|nr:hypothetical protein [Burkholderia metallica]